MLRGCQWSAERQDDETFHRTVEQMLPFSSTQEREGDECPWRNTLLTTRAVMADRYGECVVGEARDLDEPEWCRRTGLSTESHTS